MIGRGAAVAQVKGVELHGKLAFAAWLGVHAALMTGGSNRVDAFKSWADRLLRQGAGAPGARPERDAADGVGRGRRRSSRPAAGRRRGDDGRDGLRRHHHRQRRRRRHAGGSPRPVGQADPDPRARRLAAARDRELGRRRGLRQEPLRVRRTPGTTTRASRSSRASTTTSAARRSSTAPPCTACGARTSGSSATTTASRRRGRSRTTSSSRTTRGRSSCTRSTAPTARIRPRARRAAAYPFPAVSHEPRIQQLSDDLERAGYHPFHAPCGVRLLESEHAVQPVHPLRDLRRLPVARPGQVRRRDLRRAAGARASRTSRC